MAQTTEIQTTAPVRFDVATLERNQRELRDLAQQFGKHLQDGLHFGKLSKNMPYGLWDPGAQDIANSFNCYFGERKILDSVDTEDTISVVLEVAVISRSSGKRVGTGVAGASTNEAKHKWRWERDPATQGYTKAEIAKFKYDPESQRYRVPNPNRSELKDMIARQASKRAETDAVRSLPGVAGGLKMLFDSLEGGKKPAQGEAKPPQEQPQAAGKKGGQKPRQPSQVFWGEVNKLGLTPERVHHLLGVQSINELFRRGMNEEAVLNLLKQRLQEEQASEEQPPPSDLPWETTRSAVEGLGLTDKGIRQWFTRAGVENVGLDSFKKPQRPDGVTDDVLSRFLDAVQQWKDQQTKGSNQ